MRGIGKTPAGKSAPAMTKPLLATMAFLSASAAFALVPSQASAQFNIDGIIRGAIEHGGYYGSRRSSHHSSHESSHHDSADKDSDDAADSKTGKGIKSTDDSNAGAHGSGNSDAAASNTTPPKGGPSGGGTAKPSDSGDVPAFSPSR
jgi:hypothetical protein